jgi:hypothetical protein
LACAVEAFIIEVIATGRIRKGYAVKQIDRLRLVSEIAMYLQQEMKTSQINVFLGGFGVECQSVNIVPSKRLYVEELLAPVPEAVVLRIARELEIEPPNAAGQNALELKGYLREGGYEAAVHDFDRALEYASTDAEQALGSASSTLESICKGILDRFNEPYPKDESLAPLAQSVFRRMSLSPEGHADPDIKRVLGGLLNAAVGLGVLRTKYSGFHGKGAEQRRKRLSERHARLAVNAASTVGLFLVETYVDRFGAEAL